MNKIIFIIILLFGLFYTFGAEASFDHNLYYGMVNNAEVKELQKFLISKNLLSSSATGNFYSLTFVAVKKYQQLSGINTTGLVGPLTRASINKESASISQNTAAPNQNIIANTTQPSGNQPAITQNPEISIIYPESAAILKKGKPYEIKWSSTSASPLLTGDIVLYYSTSARIAGTIATGVNISSGKFLWTVPDTEMIYEGEYRIALSYNIGSQYHYNVNSNVFNIKNLSPKIVITSPSEGANFYQLRTHEINWTSTDMPDTATAKISVYYNSYSLPVTIAENALVSAGKISWTLSNISVGSYKISVVANNGIRADSGSFNIKAPEPKLEITSPTGASTWIKGQTHTISWTYQDVPPATPIIIYLCRNMSTISSTLSSIITAVPNNPAISAGSVSWMVPDTENIFAFQYIIYMTSADGALRALSNPFYIKAPGLF